MVQELPDVAHFFCEAAPASKSSALVLVAEPKGHVNETGFDAEVPAATAAGFELMSRPTIKLSYSAWLKKK